MQLINDLPYDAEHAGDDDRRVLNVALPDESNGACIFFIHGGGWTAGSKEQWRTVMEHFCAQGYVCTSAGYRLAPEQRFPTQFRDVRLAYSCVEAHAAEWGFDPQRIAVWGSSAGGHLAALLATAPVEKQPEMDSPHMAARLTRPAAVVGLCPVFSLMPGARTDVRESEVAFLGVVPADALDLARQASPTEYVTSEAPPFLILCGDADDVTPLAHQEMMMDVLRHNGVPAELVVLPGIGHGYGYGVESEAQKTTLHHAEQFLAQCLKVGATSAT